VVEQPELVAQQEGAVEALVGLADRGQGGELVHALSLGRLQERSAVIGLDRSTATHAYERWRCQAHDTPEVGPPPRSRRLHDRH
jgi:hypothetical protein